MRKTSKLGATPCGPFVISDAAARADVQAAFAIVSRLDLTAEMLAAMAAISLSMAKRLLHAAAVPSQQRTRRGVRRFVRLYRDATRVADLRVAEGAS
jgi:hypothetical protein